MKLCHNSPVLIHGVMLNNEDQEKLLLYFSLFLGSFTDYG